MQTLTLRQPSNNTRQPTKHTRHLAGIRGVALDADKRPALAEMWRGPVIRHGVLHIGEAAELVLARVRS